jgi:hypothetical protein
VCVEAGPEYANEQSHVMLHKEIREILHREIKRSRS